MFLFQYTSQLLFACFYVNILVSCAYIPIPLMVLLLY